MNNPLFRDTKRIRPFFILLFLASATAAHAQQVVDTSYTAPEIQITATRFDQPDFLQPVQVNLVDSLPLRFLGSQNIGLVLQSVTPAFIQNYGPGGAATISLRGYDSRQTQVIWNGFELNHSMLGLTDFSIIPASLISSVEVSSGNMGTAFGSGGAGGTVLLNTARSLKGIRLNGTAGSFNSRQQSIEGGWNDNHWNIYAMAFHRHAANDFRYLDPLEKETRRREHNGLSAHDILVRAGWKDSRYHIRSALWYAHEENDIPGSVVGVSDAAHQEDRFLRWNLTGMMVRGQTRYMAKAFYNRYALNYKDPSERTSSISTVYNSAFRMSVRHYFAGNLRLQGSSSVEEDKVHTNNYEQTENRFVWSNLLQLNYQPWPRLWLYGAGRFDHYSDFGETLIPSIGLNYEVVKEHFYLRAAFKKDYTAPTFNDLYWANGGNPDLKPEHSATFETGLVFRWKTHNLSLQVSPGVYQSRQHNGIRWVPAGGGTTTPVNIQEMEMKGLELSSKMNYREGAWTISLHYLLTLTQAHILSNPQSSGQVRGKQIRYVPPVSQKLFAGIGYRGLQLFVNRTAVGERFTTNDHSSVIDPLPSYSVWNLGCGFVRPIGLFTLNIHTTVYNLFDETYQVIAWYPMPHRNYALSASVTYTFQ